MLMIAPWALSKRGEVDLDLIAPPYTFFVQVLPAISCTVKPRYNDRAYASLYIVMSSCLLTDLLDLNSQSEAILAVIKQFILVGIC